MRSYEEKFVEGALENGASLEIARKVYAQIVGFSGFGFPKAHSAAFGLLAYQSTWLRVHYGPEFLCALLNEQPMGFYPPDSLVHEAQRRGIPVLPPSVVHSDVECRVESQEPWRAGPDALRPRPASQHGRRAESSGHPRSRVWTWFRLHRCSVLRREFGACGFVSRRTCGWRVSGGFRSLADLVGRCGAQGTPRAAGLGRGVRRAGRGWAAAGAVAAGGCGSRRARGGRHPARAAARGTRGPRAARARRRGSGCWPTTAPPRSRCASTRWS